MSDDPRGTPPCSHDDRLGSTLSVEYVGPFQETYVVVDGRRVPYLTASLPPGGIVSLTLDQRYGLDVPVALADRVVDFIAQAIAIGMGYSCFPRHDEDPCPRNLFPKMFGITSVEVADG